MTNYEHESSRMESDAAPFVMVPKVILDCSDRAVKLFALLAHYADNRTRECWPGRDRLAARMECSTKTVDRALKELVDAGAVTVQGRFDPDSGRQTSNLYTLRRFVGTPVSPTLDTGVPLHLDTGVAQTNNHLELENNGDRSALAPTGEIVGYYVDEYRKATGVEPPSSWKAAAGREIKRAVKDYSEKDIKHGLYFAAHQGKNPGGLLSYIAEYHLMKRNQRRTAR